MAHGPAMRVETDIGARLTVAIGLGCQRATALDTLAAAVGAALHPLGAVDVRCLASHVRKGDAPALIELARLRGWPLCLFSAAELAGIRVPNPSSRAASEVGTPSVAEAAALLAAGGRELLIGKQVYRGADGRAATVAIARVSSPGGGIGSGCRFRR